ncbi:MAG: hypothetical protein GYB67_11465 [Chloroflexi bacterium]|nr:hypothetical protein [Chloroflexota bacterium]
MGGGQRLLRLVGYAQALTLMLRAETLTPPDLAALGLVTQVAPEGEALAAAQHLAQQIATEDSAAVQSIKALLQAGLTRPYESALAAERGLFPPLWIGKTHKQSTQAFLARQTSKS